MTISDHVLLTIIKVYQKAISPLIPARCRYYPTCSEYGVIAIKWHGTVRGGSLLAMRLSRCHPLGGSGIDFVPIPLYKYQFYYQLQYRHTANLQSSASSNTINVSRETNLYKKQCNVTDMSINKCFNVPYWDKFSYHAHLNYLLKSNTESGI